MTQHNRLASSPQDGFSGQIVTDLIEHLETSPMPDLTPTEHGHLLVLLQTTLEVSERGSKLVMSANGTPPRLMSSGGL